VTACNCREEGNTANLCPSFVLVHRMFIVHGKKCHPVVMDVLFLSYLSWGTISALVVRSQFMLSVGLTFLEQQEVLEVI